ncbi:hypothetical protein E2C01_031003 [Portunus trituberculatus]|uniref:Uncharacterized protein n=1 Tax=Portunus trituberculatus TaxID=210409 RepID=A0A5B7ESH5_PORTR|nr:hypothetical protein [Portunus trituberculatus]
MELSNRESGDAKELETRLGTVSALSPLSGVTESGSKMCGFWEENSFISLVSLSFSARFASLFWSKEKIIRGFPSVHSARK